jgi:hypothetical protein
VQQKQEAHEQAVGVECGGGRLDLVLQGSNRIEAEGCV